VRSADRGTLFLDEIAELPPASQVTLLRVLQEQEVMPIGHAAAVKVDIRLCAATNADLAGLVAAGRFREDLFARLSGLTLRLPPLAERRDDLGLLVSSLLARLPAGARCRFTPAALRRLFAHSWPRNIRELERCLQTALALAEDGLVGVEQLDRTLAPTGAGGASPPSDPEARHRAELDGLLAEHGGNIAAVARALGKARTQIHRWVRRYGLRPEHYRRPDER
jgi:transcriptional regulator of acetoin/glycerol metabolism